jgi:hypothetical protein
MPGSTFQPRRRVLRAAAAAPGWPSIWAYCAFCARRPKTTSVASRPNRRAVTRSKIQPPGTSQKIPKATAAVTRNTPSRMRPILGSDFLLIR